MGPVVGGALYEVGGFTLPFAVMGSILALSSIFIYFVLPDTPQPPSPVNESVQKPFSCILKVIISFILFQRRGEAQHEERSLQARDPHRAVQGGHS